MRERGDSFTSWFREDQGIYSTEEENEGYAIICNLKQSAKKESR